MERLPNTDRLRQILKFYSTEVEGILGIAICDRNGFIFASDFKEGDEEESDSIIGAISAILDTYIDRIKSEFGSKGNFFNITMTGEKKFAFCSQGPLTILTTVADQSTSDIELKVYSEHIAGKVELILDGNEDVSPKIPEIIITNAVPKSGCFAITIAGTIIKAKQTAILRQLGGKCSPLKYHDKTIGTANFIISDG